MDDRTAILIIQDYLLEIDRPKIKWKPDDFKQQSYSRWAVNELLQYVNKNDSLPPIMVVEEFISKMNDYSCDSESSGGSYIFAVAKDIADDVLDTLYNYENY